MKPKKLIWQIYPATVIAVLAAIIAVTWYGSVVFQKFYLHEAEIDLEARANLIKLRVRDYLTASDYRDLRAFCTDAGRESHTRITIIDRSGVVLADSNEDPAKMENHSTRPEIVVAYSGRRGRSLRYSRTLSQKMLYIAIPLNGHYDLNAANRPHPKVHTVIRMSVPVTSLDQTILGLQLRVVVGCLFVVFGAALVMLFISRNISRPLEEMTRSAEQFARGDFNLRMTPRLRRTSSLEVTALATSMDRMAEVLDDKIKTIVTHRNQLEAVFSSMVESVIAIDSDERVISINTAAARLFGIGRQAAQGKVVQEIIRHSHLQEQIQKILATRESLEEEIVLQEKWGDRYLQTNVVPLYDGKGESVGVLIVMNDVTSLRRLERVRRDFVANVSHELRTPITSIRGYVETLLDGALDNREDSTRFLEVVLRQSERLSAIIEDLLALSRIEQGTSDGSISMEEGLLVHVLEAAVQTCQVNADQQGVALTLECPEGLLVMMNDTLLEQAVVNLLVNAIRYSRAGQTVAVRAALQKTTDQSQVLISVKDTGCGIAPEHQPRLFERFYRSDKARSRQQGGTGLGLAIVKHIVQAHNGTVDVKSELGKGSEFTIALSVRSS